MVSLTLYNSLEDSVLLINGVTETVKHEIKKHEGKFFGIFLTPLGASLVQRVISSVVKGISRKRIYEHKFSFPLHPLNNIEITNYYSYETRFNGVFSRSKLPRIKDGAYIINLDNKNSKGTNWV